MFRIRDRFEAFESCYSRTLFVEGWFIDPNPHTESVVVNRPHHGNLFGSFLKTILVDAYRINPYPQWLRSRKVAQIFQCSGQIPARRYSGAINDDLIGLRGITPHVRQRIVREVTVNVRDDKIA